MSAFFDMGGYGAFVWPCYGLALLFVVGLYWHTAKKLRQSHSAADTI